MSKIGIVAGSFDPITFGHAWLIKKACELIGEDGKLHVVVGTNPSKKYYFSKEERINQIENTIHSILPSELSSTITIDFVENDLLINHAKRIKATHIFRGIRNIEDFNYEQQIQQINRRFDSTIETVFFIPPSDYSEISSSTVKGLVGFNGWETVVNQYIHYTVIEDFKCKLQK